MFEKIYANCLKNSSKYAKCNKLNKNNISIINSVLVKEKIINSGKTIPFDTNRIYLTDDIINDNGEFKIYVSGIYKVTFNTNAKLHIGESSNNISLGIMINGNLIPGAVVNKSCGPNETVNIYTQVVFGVASGTTAILNIVNVKENNTIIVCDNSNIIIEKMN